MPKAKIKANDAVRDIRSGMDDPDLMAKYGLPPDALENLFKRLVQAGLLAQEEIDNRNRLFAPTVALYVPADVSAKDIFAEDPGRPGDTEEEQDLARPMSFTEKPRLPRYVEPEIAGPSGTFQVDEQLGGQTPVEPAAEDAQRRERGLTQADSRSGSLDEEPQVRGLDGAVRAIVVLVAGFAAGLLCARLLGLQGMEFWLTTVVVSALGTVGIGAAAYFTRIGTLYFVVLAVVVILLNLAVHIFSTSSQRAPIAKTVPSDKAKVGGVRPAVKKPESAKKGVKPEHALIEAAKQGRVKTVKELLKKGVNVNAKDGAGATPLIYASRNGKADVVNLLLKKGADANISGPNGEAALMQAASLGYVDTMKMLLAAGADINAKDLKGRTALMAASEKGLPVAVKVLLDKGADVNIVADGGVTALQSARNGAVRGLLVKKGAYIPYESRDFRDRRLVQAAKSGSLEGVTSALAAGADVNARDRQGDTALMVAAAAGFASIVDALIEKGANINARGRDGASALIRASGKYSPEALKLLVESGADIGHKTADGRTALLVASLAGEVKNARILVESRADVNARDKAGVTPLMIAAEIGNLELAKFLLDRGAKVEARSLDGKRAEDIAKQAGQKEIVTLIGNYKAGMSDPAPAAVETRE